MKTNRFDETIRKKLEAIQPEVTDRDWNSFQKYSALQEPVVLTGRNRKWVAYGVAASVLVAMMGVCGVLYRQNQALESELVSLRHAVGKLTKELNSLPADSGFREERDQALVNADPEQPGIDYGEIQGVPEEPEQPTEKVHRPSQYAEAFEQPHRPAVRQVQALKAGEPGTVPQMAAESRFSSSGHRSIPEITQITSGAQNAVERTKWTASMGPVNGRREVAWAVPAKSAAQSHPAIQQSLPGAGAVPKAEELSKPAEQQRALPTFITERPYRVGISVSTTPSMRSLGFVNEFLLFRNISIAWGISQTRYDQVRFFNERVFGHETGQNFRKTFGGGMPYSSDIQNIKTQTTLIQLPVALSYRYALPAGFSVAAGVSTHVNLKFRQSLGYDFWDGYRVREISGLKYRKMSYPIVNNVSPVLGLEKRFDPLVLQGEVFYHFQKDDIPYLDAGRAFGGRLKILYQIGK
ncbi:hypothetical protein GCM10023091_30720 [Ravibacter arvi]|uniref:Outer membrane protein beta-barrel domain-containing protein n=1 Tax=Ravibacter arvi TaxID=2051041 RepID=A0ABP8M415_9BACT